ncbi:peroxisomal membrane anchor protein conserved region-domain-containing protein [Xylariaceae sp. FL0662B]|nr:peroxisomal membrane anchor protein conserved region-domain-containing protein [Xylariaceae sp. FL0662B]
MADSEKSSIPSWQQSQSQSQSQAGSTTNDSESQDVLDHARKFLDDENVKNASVEKKTEFLKSKGLDSAQIQGLLEEAGEGTQAPNVQSAANSSSANENTEKPSGRIGDVQGTASDATDSSTASPSTADAPPIITYPEFLTTSPKPPPLITPSRLTNILTISSGVWTLLYGTARLVVSPMVDTLTDARTEYYTHVNERLGEMVEKLEDTASEVPYKNGKILKSTREEGMYQDDESNFSDPTELFHRDIGTQTSPIITPQNLPTSASEKTDKPVDSQARRLSALRTSLRELTNMYTHQAENSANLNALLREIRDDVDRLGAPPLSDFTSVHTGLGFRSGEPDDEVKKTKDAIRSVKGMFLSAKSFPAVSAR